MSLETSPFFSDIEDLIGEPEVVTPSTPDQKRNLETAAPEAAELQASEEPKQNEDARESGLYGGGITSGESLLVGRYGGREDKWQFVDSPLGTRLRISIDASGVRTGELVDLNGDPLPVYAMPDTAEPVEDMNQAIIDHFLNNPDEPYFTEYPTEDENGKTYMDIVCQMDEAGILHYTVGTYFVKHKTEKESVEEEVDGETFELLSESKERSDGQEDQQYENSYGVDEYANAVDLVSRQELFQAVSTESFAQEQVIVVEASAPVLETPAQASYSETKASSSVYESLQREIGITLSFVTESVEAQTLKITEASVEEVTTSQKFEEQRKRDENILSKSETAQVLPEKQEVYISDVTQPILAKGETSTLESIPVQSIENKTGIQVVETKTIEKQASSPAEVPIAETKEETITEIAWVYENSENSKQDNKESVVQALSGQANSTNYTGRNTIRAEQSAVSEDAAKSSSSTNPSTGPRTPSDPGTLAFVPEEHKIIGVVEGPPGGEPAQPTLEQKIQTERIEPEPEPLHLEVLFTPQELFQKLQQEVVRGEAAAHDTFMQLRRELHYFSSNRSETGDRGMRRAVSLFANDEVVEKRTPVLRITHDGVTMTLAA